jgi:50S ribosomal protein L16 3-hydroxylase
MPPPALALLGGLSPAAFLERHWQKRPLLVRQAIPGFRGFLERDPFLALANRGDVTARLVLEHPRRRARWERHDGPFAALEAAQLPARRWTLLIHGIESLVPGGWELLRAFSFIPAARIDDLMVSYAAPGGSVGPHDDRYDVFLLQGPGRRRWQVSTQRERRVTRGQAIRVLDNFVAEEEWVLEPGDMLYLPPGVAHHGVAETACFTYSIGFLAPSHATLARELFAFLGARAAGAQDPDALYEDPDLAPARDRLALPRAMVQLVAGLARDVRVTRAGAEELLGRYLTMPRAHAGFTARTVTADDLARRLGRPGRLTLALPTRGLVQGRQVFVNGVAHPVTRAGLATVRRLLDERALPLPLALDAATRALLLEWVRAGVLMLG